MVSNAIRTCQLLLLITGVCSVLTCISHNGVSVKFIWMGVGDRPERKQTRELSEMILRNESWRKAGSVIRLCACEIITE